MRAEPLCSGRWPVPACAGRRRDRPGTAGGRAAAAPGGLLSHTANRGRSKDMAWDWQFETADGPLVPARGVPRETFTSQGDAESWLGENWRDLLAGGVDQVTLLEENRVEYGPMSLRAE